MQEIASLEGLVVIDVVEGTAIASLPHMSAILSSRPPSFPSLQVALEWAKHTGKPILGDSLTEQCRSTPGAPIEGFLLPALLCYLQRIFPTASSCQSSLLSPVLQGPFQGQMGLYHGCAFTTLTTALSRGRHIQEC